MVMLLSSVFLYTQYKKSIFKFKFNEATNKGNHIFLSFPLFLLLFNFNQNIPRSHLSSFFYFENILSSDEKKKIVQYISYVLKITRYPIRISDTSSRSKFPNVIN